MNRNPIISEGESLQILANDLRRAVLQRRAAELEDATPERRKAIFVEIERDIRNELRKRERQSGHWNVMY